jgi:hypothetical protein
VRTGRGDKAKRGAEYSALEIFDGRILTFCDRTGNCDELVLEKEAYTNKTLATAVPLVDAHGDQVSIPMVSNPEEGGNGVGGGEGAREGKKCVNGCVL